MRFLNYNIIFDIDISNYETDYIKIRHDFLSRGVVLEFSKMGVKFKISRIPLIGLETRLG